MGKFKLADLHITITHTHKKNPQNMWFFFIHPQIHYNASYK